MISRLRLSSILFIIIKWQCWDTVVSSRLCWNHDGFSRQPAKYGTSSETVSRAPFRHVKTHLTIADHASWGWMTWIFAWYSTSWDLRYAEEPNPPTRKMAWFWLANGFAHKGRWTHYFDFIGLRMIIPCSLELHCVHLLIDLALDIGHQGIEYQFQIIAAIVSVMWVLW